jgi:hypothetical protein
MKNLKIIIKQLIKILTFDTSYPVADINIKHYSYEMKNGIIKYNQYETLINHLKK